MEILDIFFKEANRITSDYVKKGAYIKNSDYEDVDDILVLMESVLSKDEDKYKNVIDCVDFEYSAKCVSLLSEKLLSLNTQDNRLFFAKIVARELDARVSNTFSDTEFLRSIGYAVRLFERDVNDLINDIVNSFAIFDIDLVPLLQEKSDFEGFLGSYNRFRDEKFIPKRDTNNYNKELTIPSEYTYNENKILDIYNFCNGEVFNISFGDFAIAVEKADFSKIYNSENLLKNKFAYSISVIKKFVDSVEWYKKAANSIGEEPTSCSKKSVPKDWKDAINAIK